MRFTASCKTTNHLPVKVFAIVGLCYLQIQYPSFIVHQNYIVFQWSFDVQLMTSTAFTLPPRRRNLTQPVWDSLHNANAWCRSRWDYILSSRHRTISHRVKGMLSSQRAAAEAYQLDTRIARWILHRKWTRLQWRPTGRHCARGTGICSTFGGSYDKLSRTTVLRNKVKSSLIFCSRCENWGRTCIRWRRSLFLSVILD